MDGAQFFCRNTQCFQCLNLRVQTVVAVTHHIFRFTHHGQAKKHFLPRKILQFLQVLDSGIGDILESSPKHGLGYSRLCGESFGHSHDADAMGLEDLMDFPGIAFNFL